MKECELIKGGHTWVPCCKGDVARDDSQRRFSAEQYCVAMMEQCCNHSKQCRNNVVMLCCTKNRRSESSRVTSIEFKIPRRRRRQKCRLKSDFAIYAT